MTGRAIRVSLATAALALPLAGCALRVPVGATSATTARTAPEVPTRTQTQTPTSVATANTKHEYPSAPAPAEHAPGFPSAAAAVFAFANGYINWNARTVVADLTRLAHDSVGQARAAMQIEASDVAADYELRGGGIANAGTVEAVARLRATANRFVVVTRESTSASASNAYQGLRAAWHVTIATVRRTPAGGWVLSGWQPES